MAERICIKARGKRARKKRRTTGMEDNFDAMQAILMKRMVGASGPNEIWQTLFGMSNYLLITQPRDRRNRPKRYDPDTLPVDQPGRK